MVGCYTFVGPTLLIESENFSIAFFQELNINIQTNVLWPSRMKKILITVESSMCMSRRLSFPLLLLPGLKKFHFSILAIFFGLHIKAFDIRNMPRSGISKFPSKIIKKIVQIITCPTLRHVAELKLSLLLL